MKLLNARLDRTEGEEAGGGDEKKMRFGLKQRVRCRYRDIAHAASAPHASFSFSPSSSSPPLARSSLKLSDPLGRHRDGNSVEKNSCRCELFPIKKIEDFCLNATARIRPWLPYMCHIYSTADCLQEKSRPAQRVR